MKEILWISQEKAQTLIDDLKCCGLTVDVIYHTDIVEIIITDQQEKSK